MKVYTKVVIDMATLETVYQESYEYFGPVAFAGSGGGDVEGAPDFYYRHLVDAGEQEMQMAETLMNYAGYDRVSGGPSYAEMEQAQIEANLGLIPEQTELQKAQIQAQKGVVPKEAELKEEQLDQAISNAPLAGETQRLSLQEQQKITRERAPVISQFFQEAGNVDPQIRANRAQADVAQQYGQARDAAARNIARTGAVPGSGRMSAVASDLASERARSTAAARTIARQDARDERFNRLARAVSGAGSSGGA